MYYDKNWKGVGNKLFASYYRIIPTLADINFRKQFKDYYITGELQAEGEFLTIDKYDDSKSIFDGEITIYKKDGLISSHQFFKEGKLHGICTEFSEDGNLCVQIEYSNGEPLYDYYVISPHFPLDEKSQHQALKLISRVPNRKLIMVDHWMQDYSGNYGAVYQDFENDIYDGLKQGLYKLKTVSLLNIITLSSSLYGAIVSRGVERFCTENGIAFKFMESAPEEINPNEAFLILSSQLESGLAALARKIKARNLEVGKDVFIISYNEFDLCEVVMNGLTTVSTDFKQMGQAVAELILNRTISKVHCDFTMTRRASF